MVQITQNNLDIPLNELIEGVDDETPRQFIRSSEKEFGIPEANLKVMSEDELNGYIEHLDCLWEKKRGGTYGDFI